MQKVLLAWSTVFLLMVTVPAVVRAEVEVCGRGSTELAPPAYGWVCGQIIVGLRLDSAATIEEVVARQGGDADDVLERLTDIDAYVIAVESGAEPDAVATYGRDPDVRYAELNLVGGELAGPSLPDTTMAAASPMPWLVALILGSMLLGSLGLLVRRTGRL